MLLSVVIASSNAVSSTQLWQIDISNGSSLALYHFWDKCVGSGHASLALRQDYHYQLKQVQQTIGFEYVRFHGILDDDVGAVNGINDYSFINIDSIFDFLLSINMKPYVEISFMPDLFASGSQTTFHYKGNITPPKSFSDWYYFIQTLISHLVDRYSLSEVLKWYFEVWNEPNCNFNNAHDAGCCCTSECGNITTYFLFYNTTASAIKSVNKDIKVGGPTTAALCWINKFLELIGENHIIDKIDFVSSHLYPTDPDINRTNVALSYKSAFANMTSIVNNFIEKYNYNNTNNTNNNMMEIIISEFNDGLYDDSYGNHDSNYVSSFIMYQIVYMQSLFNNSKYIQSHINWMSFWTFSDIFQEKGFISIPFHNGFGMQTQAATIGNEIKKPTFCLFELIHDYIGIDNDKRYLVNKQMNNSYNYNENVQILCTDNMNSKTNNISVFITNWNNYEMNDTLSVENINIKMVFDENDKKYNISKGVKAITKYVIDEKNCNPKQSWIDLGMPTYLTRNQTEKIQQASLVVPQGFENYTVSGNVLQISVVVNVRAVVLLDIEVN